MAVDWLSHLFPVRRLQVRVRFTESVRFHWYHGAALHAFLRRLLDRPVEFPLALRPEAPESGRVLYRRGSEYQFGLTVLPGGLQPCAQFVQNLEGVRHSPSSWWDVPMPLRNNIELVALTDMVTGHDVNRVDELTALEWEDVRSQVDTIPSASTIRIDFLSPLRMEAHRESRDLLDESNFSSARFLDQCELSLLQLARKLASVDTFKLDRMPAPEHECVESALLWVDAPRKDSNKQVKPLGGLLGGFKIQTPGEWPVQWKLILAAAAHTGVGKSVSFGLGHFRIVTNLDLLPREGFKPVHSHLDRMTQSSVLMKAATEVAAGGGSPGLDGQEPSDWLESEEPLERLRLELKAGKYQSGELMGCVIPKASGGGRLLSIPNVRDRIAQRAALLTVRDGIEQLFEECSHGYRRGLSRFTAIEDADLLMGQGFPFALDADIDDFFNSVDWEILDSRLSAILGPDEPLLGLLRQWIRAPLRMGDRTAERTQGIPQGAVISPILANIFLDRFDEQMATLGFRVVRFADDFLVLCRSREDAERARAEAERILGRMALQLKPIKTRIAERRDGIEFLGFRLDETGVVDLSVLRRMDRKSGSDAATLLETADGDHRNRVPAADRTSPRFEAGSQGQYPILVLPPFARLNSRAGQVIVGRKDSGEVQVPWSQISEISLFGNHAVTLPVLRESMRRRVPVHFLSTGGSLLGSLSSGLTARGEGGMPWELWLAQARFAGLPEKRLEFARAIVLARLRNASVVFSRPREPSETWETHRAELSALDAKVRQSTSADELRGYEGLGTRILFSRLADLVAPDFQFSGRNRRPPRDPVNVLLSLGYTILHSQVLTGIEREGLLPWIGIYHQERSGHPALASDLVEEFRYLAEMVVLRVIRRHQVTQDDFTMTPGGKCRISPEALRLFAGEIQGALDRSIVEKSGGVSTTYRTLIQRQAAAVRALVTKDGTYVPWTIH